MLIIPTQTFAADSLHTNSLSKDDIPIARQPYRIEQPSSYILRMIENEGGIVAAYQKGKAATVYLTTELMRRLQKDGVAIRPVPVSKISGDTLSSDLRIGYSYHNYQAVLNILDSLAALYPQIMRVETIGFTEEGRSIQVVCISDNANLPEKEPEVCYIGAMHGNEILTQELLLCFIDSLLQNSDSDDRIKRLLDSTQIWIIPNMNFDGTQRLTRFNANGVDLNRNFPDREFDAISDTSGRAAETKTIMQWRAEHNFILAANFHTGEQVVNYPWDKHLPGQQGNAATPDDEVFVRLALSYSKENLMLYNNPQFERGIVNGALWYEINGSMQDWAYHWKNTLEVTIEVSRNVMPPVDSIRYYYAMNGQAMLSYLEQVHSGIRGVVTDAEDGQPLLANIEVSGIDKTMHTNPANGDYYRLLEPGIYDIRINVDGYQSREYKDVVVDSGKATQLDAALQRRTYWIISGNILDSLKNTPLDSVYISLWENGRLIDEDTTAEDGFYSLKAQRGQYEIISEKKHYFKHKDSLSVQSDLKLDIKLLKVIPSILAGQVFLSDGGETAGLIVYCQSRTDTLEGDDFFRLDSLRGGNIHLYAWQQKYTTTQLDTVLNNGDSLWVTIILYPGDNEFYNDFEQNDGGFTARGEWEYGEPIAGPAKAFNGERVWGTNLSGNYMSGAHKAVLESPFLFVQGMVLPQIEFYHWYDFEEKYDGGNLKISVDDGETWELLQPSPDYPLPALSEQYGNPLGGQAAYSGKNGAWQRVKADLTPYKHNASVLIRFEAGIDEQKEALGWYIDRFHLYDANATGGLTQQTRGVEKVPSLSLAPNPANPFLDIRFYLAEPSEIQLAIYDVLGRLVNKLSNGKKETGWHHIKWEGLNDHGHLSASGVYFVRLNIDNKYWVRKFILIR